MPARALATPPDSNASSPFAGGSLHIDSQSWSRFRSDTPPRSPFGIAEHHAVILKSYHQKLAAEFANLARQKRDLARSQHDFEEERAEFEKERQAFEDQKQKEQRRIDRARKKPKKVKTMARNARRRMEGSATVNQRDGYDSITALLEQQCDAYENKIAELHDKGPRHAKRRMKKRLAKGFEELEHQKNVFALQMSRRQQILNQQRKDFERQMSQRQLNLDQSDALPSFIPFELWDRWGYIKSSSASRQEKSAFEQACKNEAKFHLGHDELERLHDFWLRIHDKIIHFDVLAALEDLSLFIDRVRDALPMNFPRKS